MKQKLLLITFFLSMLSYGYSQAIARQSINAYGGSSVIIKGNILIEQSVGQSHQTETEDGTNNVRPGFIQSRTFNIITDEDNNLLSGKVYPNPATESFRIELDEEIDQATVQINSISGAIVESMDMTKTNHRLFDCSNWDNGTYTIRLLTTDGKVFKSRLIITK